MKKSYYFLWFRLHQTDQYLIWVQADHNLVYLETPSFLPTFSSKEALKQYAHTKQIQLEADPPVLHHLDLALGWLSNPQADFNCLQFLAAWHLFGDIARSVNKFFLGNQQKDRLTNQVYDKLFGGNNRPASAYDPHWTVTELKRLAEVLTQGFQLMKGVTKEIKR
ncbi:hypothetical protein [Microscilla marina]|uniref:Uncharacterized protein n=1 Tax=Microscilla marina ATCC 23134 TaxID=313606 RepID=A1ZHM4_MICM2|nr:hypothetical protein [Microscilla marina]EAY30031.1 hypothetical protein M23134_05364 [Microscilla marina ATCC 23134]